MNQTTNLTDTFCPHWWRPQVLHLGRLGEGKRAWGVGGREGEGEVKEGMCKVCMSSMIRGGMQ